MPQHHAEPVSHPLILNPHLVEDGQHLRIEVGFPHPNPWMPRLRVPGGPTLQRYLEDARLQLDNGPAKQAIRPLAVGRRNRLHIAGDGGLKSAAMLLSPAASAKRHPKDSWPYVTHALEAAAGRPKDADFSNLLPDAWASAQPPPSPA